MNDQERMSDTQHQYFDDPAVSRLMGMAVALAGEVFVLKALNERLTRALLAGGALTAEQLGTIGDSSDLQRWMTEERDAFARALMEPIRDPDIARRFHAEIFGQEGPNYDLSDGAADSAGEAPMPKAGLSSGGHRTRRSGTSRPGVGA